MAKTELLNRATDHIDNLWTGKQITWEESDVLYWGFRNLLYHDTKPNLIPERLLPYWNFMVSWLSVD